MQSIITQAQPADGVAAQLRDIERQGGGMARFAHICAALLLVAGSLGSLISISAQAFAAFLGAAQAGRLDLPDLLNAVVGVLLVLAGDAALLYAASMLRVLRSAQAPREESKVHLWVMWGVSALEAGTYLYMAWLFDRPSNLVLWLIDIGRAIAWPLLCAYLSMARPLPVGPRDIMYHSALASGKGVVRDIATLSADPDAPLHHKVRIFRAASNMTPADRGKLDTLVSELTTAHTSPAAPALPPLEGSAQLAPALPQPQYVPAADAFDIPWDRPPTGGGTPSARPRSSRTSARAERPAALRLATPPEWREEGRRTAAQARSKGTHTRQVRTPKASVEAKARDAWRPGMSVGELERAAGISRSAAGKYRRTFIAEAEERAAAEASSASAGQLAQ